MNTVDLKFYRMIVAIVTDAIPLGLIVTVIAAFMQLADTSDAAIAATFLIIGCAWYVRLMMAHIKMIYYPNPLEALRQVD